MAYFILLLGSGGRTIYIPLEFKGKVKPNILYHDVYCCALKYPKVLRTGSSGSLSSEGGSAVAGAGESCVVFLCFDRQNVNNRYSLSLRRIPTATKGFKEK